MNHARSAAIVASILASSLISNAVTAQQTGAPPAAMQGRSLFQARCASCHEPAVGRAPDRARLAQLGALEVFNELKNGSMRAMAEGLKDEELGAIAGYVSPPAASPVAPAPSPGDPPQCARAAAFSLRPSDWNGWGQDPRNWRRQTQPGFSAAGAPRLKVKWSFAYNGGKYGQPVVVGGRVFLTSIGGRAYSLDDKTGCMHWRFDGATSRTAISIGRSGASPSGYAAYLGDNSNTVYALDALSGKLIWKQKVETHKLAILTGSPALDRDRLYVPLSSYEELTASAPTYPCCTFRGGVVALDATTGKVLWKTYTITAAPGPTHRNSAGTQMYGPAGAAIWSAPTVDAKRGLLYVATGDSYTDVVEDGSDSVIAIELATGRVRWRAQVTKSDNYLSGCTPEHPLVNCPATLGHDFDFGASPILMKLPRGADILLAGQKSGVAYGIDPQTGRMLWSTKVGEGGPLGGIEFGMATDGERLYVANADAFMPSPPGKPGLAALDPATGKQLWFTPAPHLHCGWTVGSACMNGLSAPPTVIPGLVFAGDLDGRLRAYDADTGRVVWELDTSAATYRTVNGVAAQPGGNIDGTGPVVADGMLFVMSGYLGNLGGVANTVLLAFAVDGGR
jgi:polyvinyl alcohol dehydrogenase (cytochrome)